MKVWEKLVFFLFYYGDRVEIPGPRNPWKIQFWSRIIFESCKETNEKLADKEDASSVPKIFSGTKITPPKGTLEDDLPFPR